MRKVLAVAAKELRQIRRDRRSLLILLFVPAFFLLVYGYALNFDIRHIRLAVQDDDRSSASREVVSGIRDIVRDNGKVLHINELRTMHLAPHEILLALSVDFADGMSSQAVEKAVSQLEREIKQTYPEVRRVFIEVQANKDGAVRISG